jgi:hypothetical protein
MCLPPINEPPAKHFQIMQSLANNNNIKYLSMGMSNDYEIALKYGSTHVRVGYFNFWSKRLVENIYFSLQTNLRKNCNEIFFTKCNASLCSRVIISRHMYKYSTSLSLITWI